MKNIQLITLINDDLTKIGLIGTSKITKKLNIHSITWWRLNTKGYVSNTMLKKISYITGRPYSEYKKLKED